MQWGPLAKPVRQVQQVQQGLALLVRRAAQAERAGLEERAAQAEQVAPAAPVPLVLPELMVQLDRLDLQDQPVLPELLAQRAQPADQLAMPLMVQVGTALQLMPRVKTLFTMNCIKLIQLMTAQLLMPGRDSG